MEIMGGGSGNKKKGGIKYQTLSEEEGEAGRNSGESEGSFA